jgi:hypothetical protein
MSMAPGASTIFFNSIQDAFVDVFNWLTTAGMVVKRREERREQDSNRYAEGIPRSFSMSLGVTGASAVCYN